jgi:hypothetical protein
MFSVWWPAQPQEQKDLFKEWATDKPESRYTDASGPNRQNAIAIRVWFDENGEVADKCKIDISYTCCPPSVLDHIKRLVKTIAPKAF